MEKKIGENEFSKKKQKEVIVASRYKTTNVPPTPQIKATPQSSGKDRATISEEQRRTTILPSVEEKRTISSLKTELWQWCLVNSRIEKSFLNQEEKAQVRNLSSLFFT